MLLICGGQSRTINQNHNEEPIAMYPSVLAALNENEKDKLEVIMSNIQEPFVIRLCDKDLIKIAQCIAGIKAE